MATSRPMSAKERRPGRIEAAATKRVAPGSTSERRLEWLSRIQPGRRVKYTGVVETIADAIAGGEIAEGERLPAHRDLAARFGVTIATVTKAIGDLTRRGLVIARPGSGTFVANAVAVDPSGSASMADLSVNYPPLAPVSTLLESSLEAITRSARGAGMLGYEAVGGDLSHRQATAAWLARRGIEAHADDVLVTQGANEGLIAALRASTRHGETVACESVNYAGLRRIADLLGLRLVGIEMDEEGLRPDLLAARAASGLAALVCTPVTHNPTAITMSRERRAEILGVAAAAQLTVIEDDIYGHLAGDRTECLFGLAPERVIYVSSLSKCIAAGLRIGFLAASRSTIGRLREALYTTSWTAPALYADLATDLILSGRADACVAAQKAEAAARIGLAQDILGPLLPRWKGDATYHIWVAVENGQRADEQAAELMRRGVLVSPAHHFAMSEGEIPSALRVGLGAVDAREELAEALAKIATVLGSRRLAFGAIA